ncbi:hypothetical protein O181_070582 [Austropuccinia psidii MF-1]|uniref:Chromo domain-containing protein n=1 Tax=Austropuccinia psidii MF-1 TaxID=1389203 RepID=A0A9Q3F666_9BASI|nr:hypothetical protein [Austropuccinia psidii MF-1]
MTLTFGTIHYHQIDREKCSGRKAHKGILSKNPGFTVSMVKPYHQTEEETFPSRNKIHTPKDIVEVEDSTDQVKKIIKARKIRLNEKNSRGYLVRLKDQKVDKDEWLPDGDLNLRRFRASRGD